ncbi:hypothetical protein F8203_gp189 [Heliothis virescens ascovirus 3f]|uniref:Uncharacterized protein n=1 Tax=Heliothis virescens ascovirus 3f TaxID=328614 RepID=A0A171PVS7_9VIRU|nr:hypothetical protein F8203_gp189 [Heliothis virescens ascovirus 3f]AJP09155.1 hypothetical protein [Heliothis virescens ascovirus 3f]
MNNEKNKIEWDVRHGVALSHLRKRNEYSIRQPALKNPKTLEMICTLALSNADVLHGEMLRTLRRSPPLLREKLLSSISTMPLRVTLEPALRENRQLLNSFDKICSLMSHLYVASEKDRYSFNSIPQRFTLPYAKSDDRLVMRLRFVAIVQMCSNINYATYGNAFENDPGLCYTLNNICKRQKHLPDTFVEKSICHAIKCAYGYRMRRNDKVRTRSSTVVSCHSCAYGGYPKTMVALCGRKSDDANRQTLCLVCCEFTSSYVYEMIPTKHANPPM